MTREQMQLNADMSTQMTERFNVAGALLVKLFGRPDEEAADVLRPLRPRARHRRQDRDGEPGLLHRAHPRRRAGHRARLRRRRQPGHHRRPHHRHAARARRAARPALRPAHRAVQRARRRHDGARQLRAGLRGARPRADGERQARRRTPCPTGRPPIEFDHVRFRYPSADEVSLASLESVARAGRRHRCATTCCATSPSPPSRARWSRSSGRPARARPRSPRSSPASTT